MAAWLLLIIKDEYFQSQCCPQGAGGENGEDPGGNHGWKTVAGKT